MLYHNLIAIYSNKKKTRQVYNGPRTLNLSQQQQKKFWSKNDFLSTKSKKFYRNFFFQKTIWEKIKFGKNIFEKKIFWKEFEKNFFKKILKFFSTSSNYT